MASHAAIALALALLRAGVAAGGVDVTEDARLREIAAAFRESTHAPGVTVAVAMPDGSVRGAAVGLARKEPSAQSMLITVSVRSSTHGVSRRS